MHLLSSASDRYRFIGLAIASNDARLIHNDFIVLNNDGIGSAKVNGNLLC
jgi:hypothetical protein